MSLLGLVWAGSDSRFRRPVDIGHHRRTLCAGSPHFNAPRVAHWSAGM